VAARRVGFALGEIDLIVVDIGERDAWALSSVSAPDESRLQSFSASDVTDRLWSVKPQRR
jgi:hypothetical protein